MLPGDVPLVAAWYGLLGGIVASLSGTFYYNSKWDDSYDLWHAFSGTIGAIYGTAAYLILAMVAHTASATGAAVSVDASSTTVLVGSFFLGFSQREFSALGKKVFSIVFHSVDDPAQKSDPNKND